MDVHISVVQLELGGALLLGLLLAAWLLLPLLLVLVGVVGVLAQVLHAVLGVAQHYIDLQRHQLLHENEVGEVGDSLQSGPLAKLTAASLVDNAQVELIVDYIETLLFKCLLGLIKGYKHFLMSPLHLLL